MTLGEDSWGFTGIHETLGEDSRGFVRLWERINLYGLKLLLLLINMN